jgi:23S rRNA pseudouridine2605 synthase
VSTKHQSGRVSLERALSKLGLASRTEAAALIASGQVKVHGTLETNAKRMVNPDTAHIEVLGQKAKRSETVLLAFHKPKNVLTTKRDPEGRKTIYDLLPKELHSLHAVGRLDQNTTGLLLLTNDTKLSSFLTNPENQITRTYVVSVRGEFTEENIQQAKAGVRDEDDLLQAKEITLLKTSQRESRLQMVLTEGKNREIRRLCLALGHEVISLIRIQFGEYVLGELKAGEYRFEKMNPTK